MAVIRRDEDWTQGTLADVVATPLGLTLASDTPTDQFWEDWGSSTVGQRPTGWTPRWDAGVSWTVVDTPDGRAVRASVTDFSGWPWSLLSWDAIPVASEVEIAGIMRPVSGDLRYFGAALRCQAGATFSGYAASANTSGRLTIWYDAGASSSSAALSAPWAYGQKHLFRLRTEGNTVRIKAWLDGEAEPPQWVNATRNEWPGAGLVGLTTRRLSSRVVEWLGFGVGINGATAPLGPPQAGDGPPFVLAGTRMSPPLDLSSAWDIHSGIISWIAQTPAGTAITVEASLDGGLTWQTCTNGQPVPGVTGNMTGKTLLLRQTLATNDHNVAPILESLTVGTTVLYRTSAQTLRIAVSSAVAEAQTRRNLISATTTEAQTQRHLTTQTTTQAQTQRSLTAPTTATSATQRQLQAEATTTAQTTRKLQTAATTQTETQRRLTASTTATSQAERRLQSATKAQGQSLRRLTAPTSTEAQTQRKLTTLAVVTAQGMRRLTALVVYSGHATRRLSAMITWTWQTLRQLVDRVPWRKRIKLDSTVRDVIEVTATVRDEIAITAYVRDVIPLEVAIDDE